MALINAQIYENASCIRCEAVNKEMIKIGAFIMCPVCVVEEFESALDIDTQGEVYQKWLKIYKEQP